MENSVQRKNSLLIVQNKKAAVRLFVFDQNVSGSTDEKLPFMYLSALQAQEDVVIFIVNGAGLRECAFNWLKTAIRSKLYQDPNSNKKIWLKSFDEFSNWLNENHYNVNSSGSIFTGRYTNVATMYGSMYNYAALDERAIGDRYFVLQIPQIYIGEGINPGSLSIVDNYSGKTFIDDGYSNLTYSTNLDLVVGNVFYGNGIITVTYKTENTSDENYYFGNTGFTLTYQSTKTIYENEVFLEVSQNEFNVSTNPSATVNYNGATYVRSLIDPSVSGSSNGHDFRFVSRYNGTSKIGFNDYEFSSSIDPTGSYIAPYITTIGLYDDYYNLVAVAKIPSKPKSMSDYPINFIVRFDT